MLKICRVLFNLSQVRHKWRLLSNTSTNLILLFEMCLSLRKAIKHLIELLAYINHSFEFNKLREVFLHLLKVVYNVVKFRNVNSLYCNFWTMGTTQFVSRFLLFLGLLFLIYKTLDLTGNWVTAGGSLRIGFLIFYLR